MPAEPGDLTRATASRSVAQSRRRREVFAAAALGVAAGSGCRAPALGDPQPRSDGAAPAAGDVRPVAVRVGIAVETTRSQRSISRQIYGVAHATPEELAATSAVLNRWGGNPSTRYNWRHGAAWNAARDWEFRNYGATNLDARIPSAADRFIESSQAAGADCLISVPAIGWVAANAENEVRSLGVPPRGAPPATGAEGAIQGYDPAANRRATSVRSKARRPGPAGPAGGAGDGDDPVVYQDAWVRHLVDRFGPAASGGVRYYAVDNEPDLWAETHTDVRPVRASYDELRDVFLEYAATIKDADPTASVLGPCLSGWSSMFGSPRDTIDRADRSAWTTAGRLAGRLSPAARRFMLAPDRRAHGDQDFLPWWLAQVRQHDQRAGRRTLDYLDVHCYPQGQGIFAGETDDATNALRLRSTRALWDASYVDESWIGEPMRLIPRLREWVDGAYPDTKLAIGEWSWGADASVNGALAIADVLGIFGREGLDLATYWTVPKSGTPGTLAFAAYTNFDGNGAAFGDRSLAAVSQRPDVVTVYAARREATGEVTLVLLNKQPEAGAVAAVHCTGRPSVGPGRRFQYSGAAPAQIVDLGPVSVEEGRFELLLPPASLSIIRIGG